MAILNTVGAWIAPSMTPAEGITKLGFRRWYERQLIEGHLYFVTCFLSMILVAVCLEQMDWKRPLGDLALVAYVAGGLFLCLLSIRRYNYLLMRAECLAEQSVCAQCATYGVLQVLAAGAAPQETQEAANPDNLWLRVRCKKCGHEWRMDNG
jgi:hypothetical protein